MIGAKALSVTGPSAVSRAASPVMYQNRMDTDRMYQSPYASRDQAPSLYGQNVYPETAGAGAAGPYSSGYQWYDPRGWYDDMAGYLDQSVRAWGRDAESRGRYGREAGGMRSGRYGAGSDYMGSRSGYGDGYGPGRSGYGTGYGTGYGDGMYSAYESGSGYGRGYPSSEPYGMMAGGERPYYQRYGYRDSGGSGERPYSGRYGYRGYEGEGARGPGFEGPFEGGASDYWDPYF